MTITIANCNAVLGQRLRRLLAAVGLDSNSIDLNDAISYAVRELGGTVASASGVVDNDLTGVSATDENQFFDIAEYRALETLINELSVKVTMQVGPRSQNYSDIAAILDKILSRKAKTLKDKYGIGLSTITGGVIDLAFAETNSTSS